MPSAEGARKIRVNGWRQGKLVKTQDHATLPSSLSRELPDSGRVLIVSQDCDLVNESYDAEPSLEVIVAVPVEGQPDGSLTYGKNPRKVHVPFQSEGAESWYQCSAGDRYFLPRTILKDIAPDPDCAITSHGCNVLVRWLANRYRRAAFPDEFNNRLRGVQSKSERAVKRQGSDLAGIYIRLNTMQELPESKSYKVILLGAMEEADFIVEERRAKAEALIQSMANLMGGCPGVEVVESGVVSEQEFPVADLRRFKNWNFDAITLRTPGDARLPPV